MTRINLFPLNSVAWGKSNHAKANSTKNNFDKTSTLIFAALLLACSLTVGCSSDKPKPVSTNEPVANRPTHAARYNQLRAHSSTGRASRSQARSQENRPQSSANCDLRR